MRKDVFTSRGISSVEEHLQSAVEAAKRYIAQKIGRNAAKAMAMADSPIEKVLITNLVMATTIIPEMWPVHIGAKLEWQESGFPDAAFCIPQAKVAPYRVDFLFVLYDANAAPIKHVVVECDGHDFHEKTKAQAQKDKARDRFFTKRGWHVLRYTGSEIWANPEDVAVEILNFVFGLEE